nr:neurofilament heavy polypeptide-like [Quercus suber]
MGRFKHLVDSEEQMESFRITYRIPSTVDKRATRRRLRLINRESLDRILRSEIYVNPSDGQLRAAHLILKYKPASTAFQAPQYVIKAKDPRIHRISVIFEGFIVPEGELIPEGEPFTEPLSEAIISTGASSSRSTPQKVGEGEEEEEAEEEDEGGEEEEEEEEEEEIPGGPAELPDSADELEVFDHLQSPEATSKKMVIQRRSQRSLKEVIEGQPGRVVERQIQVQAPPPPPSLPQSSQPIVNEPSDPKRRRESKGKGVMDAGRTLTTTEGEDQRVAKQQKTGHGTQREVDKTTTRSSDPEVWLPTPMLDKRPTKGDASIRDFSGGLGCRVASALEETLLLPKDMAELRAIKRDEVFQNTKRYLGMAVQATFRLEEIAKFYYDQIDDEKKKRISAVRILNASEQNIAQLKKKLATAEEARKSADSALEGFQRQAEDQGRLLRDANAQLAASKEQGYNMGVVDTEDNFRAEVPAVCREYCARTWQEALDRAGVESSSELRRPENIYFPPAIRASTPSTAVGEVSVIVAEPSERAQTQALPSLSQQEPLLAPDKEKDPPSAKETTGFKDGAASQTFEQALASTTRPVEDAPMVQEKDTPQEVAGRAPPKLQIKLTK